MTGELFHILVVDDDRRLRDLLRKYLTENGFMTATATDAADARQKLKSLTFDLIVLDVMMPGESGLEFVRSLRAESISIPVLLLTAWERRRTGLPVLKVGPTIIFPSRSSRANWCCGSTASCGGYLRRHRPNPCRRFCNWGITSLM